MMYETYQTYADAMAPLRCFAAMVGGFAQAARPWFGDQVGLRGIAAGCGMFARAGISHERPPFGINRVVVDGREVAVSEEISATKPFCNLLHFKKAGGAAQPRVLLVAPMSGHFATLLRGTVRTLLADHDVWVTDWKNARDVSLVHGGFGLDDFTNYIIGFLKQLGPGTHVIAVCQPAAAVIAAISLLAQARDPAQPASMTLIGGPVDTRINPTEVNKLATSRPLEWFERNVIDMMPPSHPGAFRRVYPGFLQITGFMLMNLDRHVNAQAKQFASLIQGDDESAEATQAFYDEYLTVMDLPADFYLETVREVFQDHSLAKGQLRVQGRLVDPSAIRQTALLTIEGEGDDICGVGQTQAAHALCANLPEAKHRHHLQPGVGHYGLFNGRRWAADIYPVVRNHIRQSEPVTS
ncbi:MAG TPA: polyhydroxyalkanoate depolymerase [Acidocella sp.]|nr:polyhydroxyalkanoate depolymerase [Acidocella sp.]